MTIAGAPIAKARVLDAWDETPAMRALRLELPQPFATVVQTQNPAVRTALSLTDEWAKVAKDSQLVTGVVVARTTLTQRFVIAPMFALAPALQLSLVSFSETLKEGGWGVAGSGWRKFGSGLVTAEVAIAVVLLVGAGLLLKSVYKLLRVDTGFSAEQARQGAPLTAQVNARYFFDAPAGDVKIHWSLTKASSFFDLPGYQTGVEDNRWMEGNLFPQFFDPYGAEVAQDVLGFDRRGSLVRPIMTAAQEHGGRGDKHPGASAGQDRH